MVTIAKDRDLVTLINVFTVAPEDQQRLVDVLVDATQAVMRNQQGFISANIHSSFDGRRVTGEGTLSRGDAGMDRGCNLEEARPR
jgi:hypothetical protein